MESTLSFPSVSRPASVALASGSELSTASAHQATALQVCDLVYGEAADAPDWEAVEGLYEANATYENPLVTASSRDQIAELYALCRACSALDVPRPLAMISAVLRRAPGFRDKDVLLRGVRAWSEVGDVCESESFDGHRRCIVEHTIHVLFFPGLHTAAGPSPKPAASSSSLDYASSVRDRQDEPALVVPGTRLALPSPLHMRLPVTTRLDFNDAGRITHHRDIWDVRDVLALVPGASAAQWLARRVAAQALSAACRAGGWVFGGGAARTSADDVEHGEGDVARLRPKHATGRSARH